MNKVCQKNSNIFPLLCILLIRFIGGGTMDNQMILNMFSNMLDKMNDKEIEATLNNLKNMVSPQDFEKVKAIIQEKKHNTK